jgi:hypothetical protein
MKKSKIKSIAIVLPFAIALIATSCQKLFDYIQKPGNGDAVSKICQVQTINSDGPYGANYVFNYNKRGDLESIITDKPNDGNANVFITYDNKHRAVEVLSSFTPTPTTPGSAWSWEKLGYNKDNQIVVDTLYGIVSIGPDGAIVISNYFLSITQFQYDANNRVVASDDSAWFRGSYSNREHYAYKYDANGNLNYTARQSRSWNSWGESIYNDTFRVKGYDNKISIRRTDKMWMFLDRNYSMNNSLSGATYNTYGLPVFFDSQQYLQGLTTIITFVTGNVTVQYNCEGSQN